MELALAVGIYLVGVITGVMIAVAVFSDRRIKIDPTEDGGQYL